MEEPNELVLQGCETDACFKNIYIFVLAVVTFLHVKPCSLRLEVSVTRTWRVLLGRNGEELSFILGLRSLFGPYFPFCLKQLLHNRDVNKSAALSHLISCKSGPERKVGQMNQWLRSKRLES